jgi:hypothetical protein
MTTAAATPESALRTDEGTSRLVVASIAIGIVGLVGLGISGTFFTTSSGAHFDHTADYWLTASGLPIAVGTVGTLLAVHWRQRGADGRLGAVGTWLGVLAMVELFVQLSASVLTSTEQQWGPSYILFTGLGFVAHALLAAGSWRTGVLPRWMLGVWPLVWVLGSFAAVSGPLPVLLIVFYVALGAVLERRGTSPSL